MPTAWFIVSYVTHDADGETRVFPAREPALIGAAGIERYATAECLGNRAICKVRAPLAVLQAVAALPGVKRLPKDRLDDQLADLPLAVRRALRDEALDMGYTLDEIQARFGNDLGQYTLRQVVRFMLSRRREARREGDTVALDGDFVACRDVEDVDAEVSE